MARLGIMGGTFDPIHYGHLMTAEEARERFGLDKVLFVPSGHPPHKKLTDVSDAEHRYLMTVLATLSNPAFEVSRVDVDREGITYTVDTLRDLHRLYPDDELYFITGADAVLEIITWKDAHRLVELCDFIAATRPGYPIDALEEKLGALYTDCRECFHFVEVPALAISSTDIRARVREGRPIRYLLPESVVYYIEKNGLYLEGRK
ncbi:MAG: nicotinate-nucleotide adenylyltransferase [Firmicutes bacterium]|nr:nicotinate-nucleotide adenylyltransferase [Bacillota bacterium]